MSDLAAAAAAMGGPEELVLRSAKARAQAAGVPVEDILAAWAAGGSAPSGSAAAAPQVEAAAQAEIAAASETPAPAVESAQPAQAPADAPATTAAASTQSAQVPPSPGGVVVVDRRAGAAPVLTGRVDRPELYVVGIVLLFLLGVLVAVVLPAQDAQSVAADQLPGTTPVLTDLAERGRQVYVQEGCFYCHTQMVRSAVTDVGLGTVTEPGTSAALAGDTFGHQRIGPDLTHVGSREPTSDPAYLRSFLVDPSSVNPDTQQPAVAYLSDEDLDALVQYLVESQ